MNEMNEDGNVKTMKAMRWNEGPVGFIDFVLVEGGGGGKEGGNTPLLYLQHFFVTLAY